MPSYHPQRIEPKWQAYWDEHTTFRVDDFAPGKPKLYVLDMFPYPSAAGLHGDLGAALANLERWPSAIAHLAAAVVLGVDEPDEQWGAACSQLIDTLNECGDQERAEAVRVWALASAQDDKARAWLEDDESEDEEEEPETP